MIRRSVDRVVWVGLVVLTILAGLGACPWWSVAVIASWIAASYRFRCWHINRQLGCMTARFYNAAETIEEIRGGARVDQAAIWWRIEDQKLVRRYFRDNDDYVDDDDDHEGGDRACVEPI